jgi:hypothetical protein
MLAWIDCLSLSELTADEIRAIAEHERLSEMAALSLGHWLVHLPDGSTRLKRIILDDLEDAIARRDHKHAAELRLTIRHFCQTHPENPGRCAAGTRK